MLNKPVHCEGWAALKFTNSHKCIFLLAIFWAFQWWNLNCIVLLFYGTLDYSATCFWFDPPFFLLAVVSALLEFEGEGMTSPCCNIYTVASILALSPGFVLIRTRHNTVNGRQEFRWGMSNPRTVSGPSAGKQLHLKSVVMESNGLVKAALTQHSHLTRSGQVGGKKSSAL